ncbi:hypothetical protein HUW46_09366 [Amycolatopsis sp. CA-230715]|nr:hypothetical protein HUW46_09366 [Amycolatopsis sp. CA-230715]
MALAEKAVRSVWRGAIMLGLWDTASNGVAVVPAEVREYRALPGTFPITGNAGMLSWSECVTAAARQAAARNAQALIVVDAVSLEAVDGEPASSALSDAVTRLCAQVWPGIVSVPVVMPWWQRLPAIHVARALSAPWTGTVLRDECPRTFVASRTALDEITRVRWFGVEDGGWATGHALGLLAAVRVAHQPLDVGEAEPIGFTGEIPGRPVLDRVRLTSVARAALAGAKAEVVVAHDALSGIPADEEFGEMAPPPEVVATLGDVVDGRAPAGRGSRGDWAAVLIDAWESARTGQTPVEETAAAIAATAMDRIAAWLPEAMGRGYSGRAAASAEDAADTFWRHAMPPRRGESGERR